MRNNEADGMEHCNCVTLILFSSVRGRIETVSSRETKRARRNIANINFNSLTFVRVRNFNIRNKSGEYESVKVLPRRGFPELRRARLIALFPDLTFVLLVLRGRVTQFPLSVNA